MYSLNRKTATLGGETMSMEISVVDSHTAGEPTRTVSQGLPELSGTNLKEKALALEEHFPSLPSILTGEPRGHAAMHAVLPVAASVPEADVAFLFVSSLGMLEMCGHALIGGVTTLLETGALAVQEPITCLKIETLSGLIDVEAQVSDGHVVDVTFTNTLSWVLANDVNLEVPGIGDIRLDLVYGGLWYAVLDAKDLGLSLEIAQVPKLVAMSHTVRQVLNATLPELVPTDHAPTRIPQLLYTDSSSHGERSGRNLATSTELGFDRSPCGTGSSARMALLHNREQLALDETFLHESVLGTMFEGRLVAEHPAPIGTGVIPTITGSAHLTAFSDLFVDPTDPLGQGFFIPAAVG